MLNLNGATWIRFAVWMAIGLVMYLTYGQRNARLNRTGAGRGAESTVDTGGGRR